MYAKYLADRRVENQRGTRHYFGRSNVDGEPMSQKALGGISKVKSWVKKGFWENVPKTKRLRLWNEKKQVFVPLLNHSKHLFIDIGLEQGKYYAMFDIKSAFPNIAKVYGLINEDIHNYLMSIDNKIERLACLGASSSDKITYKLDENGEKIDERHDEPVSVGFFNCIISALSDWTNKNILEKDEKRIKDNLKWKKGDEKRIVKAVYMDAVFLEIEKGNEKVVLDFIKSVNAVDKEIQLLPKDVYYYLETKKIIDFDDRERFLTTFVTSSGELKEYLFQHPNKNN